jgi:hypothetical protein
LWNASIALNAQHWSLTLLARNLGNSKAISGVFSEGVYGSEPLFPEYNLPWHDFVNSSGYGFFGNTSRQLITTPRTIGLIAKYRF